MGNDQPLFLKPAYLIATFGSTVALSSLPFTSAASYLHVYHEVGRYLDLRVHYLNNKTLQYDLCTIDLLTVTVPSVQDTLVIYQTLYSLFRKATIINSGV